MVKKKKEYSSYGVLIPVLDEGMGKRREKVALIHSFMHVVMRGQMRFLEFKNSKNLVQMFVYNLTLEDMV